MINSEEIFSKYINESGLDVHFSSEHDLEIRLYHDLHIYGDIAESCIELLRDKYHVDMSQFEFQNYFPPEFFGENQFQRVVFSFIPFIRKKCEAKRKYAPLTFLMIKEAIRTGVLE